MGLFSRSPDTCEWCGDWLKGKYIYNNFTLSGFLGLPKKQRHWGYFCSPKCRMEALAEGLFGSAHFGNQWFVTPEKAHQEWQNS